MAIQSEQRCRATDNEHTYPYHARAARQFTCGLPFALLPGSPYDLSSWQPQSGPFLETGDPGGSNVNVLRQEEGMDGVVLRTELDIMRSALACPHQDVAIPKDNYRFWVE